MSRQRDRHTQPDVVNPDPIELCVPPTPLQQPALRAIVRLLARQAAADWRKSQAELPTVDITDSDESG